MQDFKDDKETYLLLILSDSNLPTGSFVASSGLESTATHGLFHAAPPTGSDSTDSSNILAFLRNSVDTYARSALPFARDAHRVSAAYAKREIAELDVALAALARIDALYDASTLNSVARRASCAQGIALLTLYSKGFTRPAFLFTSMTGITTSNDHASLLDERERDHESRAGALIAALKLRVRQGESDDAPGHLPVCWGVLAGALGLDVDRGAHLHLFLHARGVVSAAVRMNILGPYAAQQLLLHAVKPLLCEAISSTAHLVSGALKEDIYPELPAEQLPATTWPLGEILSARHDLLHSRIFNS
ncbi:hypothetical protein F5888DRAFT_680416 [Russula emetica]|nr:hypothetical protein F5888DRAFT_680416 [Russula emetica]